MAKKRLPGKSLDPQRPAPTDSIKYETVGSGLTEQIRYRIPSGVIERLLSDPWKPLSIAAQRQVFDLHFGRIIGQAKQIVEDTGLSINLPALWEGYAILGGGLQNLPADAIFKFVKAEGYRRHDPEWYAAYTLASLETLWRGMRDGNSRGEAIPPVTVAVLAFKLGRNVREAEIRIGRIGEQTRKAGTARGKQIKVARDDEHAAIRVAAANMDLRLKKLNHTLTKRSKAEHLKKMFPHLSVETIRKRI